MPASHSLDLCLNFGTAVAASPVPNVRAPAARGRSPSLQGPSLRGPSLQGPFLLPRPPRMLRWPQALVRRLGEWMGMRPRTEEATGGTAPVPTGWTALDEALPWGGWQAGEVVEVCSPHPGWTEIPLLWPLLRHATVCGHPVGLLGLPPSSPLPSCVTADWCVSGDVHSSGARGEQNHGATILPALRTAADWQAACGAADRWFARQGRRALLLVWALEAPAAGVRRLRRLARRTGAWVCVVRPSLARWDDLWADARLALLCPGVRGAQVQVRTDNRPLGRTLQLAWQADIALPPAPLHLGDAQPRVRVRQDPHDRRRAVVSGRLDEVCQALDRLAREEARASSEAHTS